MEDPGSPAEAAGRRGRWRGRWDHFLGVEDTPDRRAFQADWKKRQPGFRAAVAADARSAALGRGDRFEFDPGFDTWTQVLRLAVVTDAFLALVCYRAKVACQVRGVPLLPRLLHRLAIMTGQIQIGDPVVIEPGVAIPHGQVVIDGMTHIGRNVTISPFVSIGLVAGEYMGPTIGAGSRIGTGSRVLGHLTLGRHVMIGANSVVLGDVADRATAVGAPARVVSSS